MNAVDRIGFYAKSALNGFETLDLDTAAENAKSDLKSILRHVTCETQRAGKLRHLAEVGLSGIDVTDTEDSLEIAALCLSEILKNVADDPIAVQIVSRIEARFAKNVHLSDCALHNLPALWPHACDCGVAKADIERAKASCRVDYILAAHARKWRQLWSAQIAYLRENRGSLRHYLRTVASSLGLDRRRRRNREHVAPRS